MPDPHAPRRTVVTGIGLISPLGNSPEALREALASGRSGVRRPTMLPADGRHVAFAGECQFTGAIEDFGPLEPGPKKAIRKALKLMCRETQMCVAAAQLAMNDAGLAGEGKHDPDRAGVVVGADYMLTMPEDYTAGVRRVQGDPGRWGDEGMPELEPLWMLKYLPNMPASHIAILNDLRGPNNSLTMRESAGLLALGEAHRTIARGHADIMLAGATGTRLLPMQALHVVQTEELASGGEPEAACRPFDLHRTGAVPGEGAGMLVLESAASAEARGARVYGDVLGFGASLVADRGLRPDLERAVANAVAAALSDAALGPDALGHVNAHGVGTREADAAEARGLARALGPAAQRLPTVALKSAMGHLGAGSSVVELAGSLVARDALPVVLNYSTPDPGCPVNPVTRPGTPPGARVLKVAFTPQAQAVAVVLGLR